MKIWAVIHNYFKNILLQGKVDHAIYLFKADGTSREKELSSKYLEHALKAVQSGGMSIRQASQQNSVPYTTLNDRFHNRHPLSYGRETVLNSEKKKI